MNIKEAMRLLVDFADLCSPDGSPMLSNYEWAQLDQAITVVRTELGDFNTKESA